MISDRLTGKVALITGAASGVGRATAHRFATEGCAAVYLFDRNAEGLETVVAELEGMTRAVAFVGDVGIDEDCKRAVDEVVAAEGHLDIFLGNAPAHSAAAFLTMSTDEWDRVLRINLRSSFVLGQRVAQAMVDQKTGGSIMFTASVSALGASKEYAHYGASKAGIVNLVQTMAIELVEYGIRVNAVSPGPLDTPQSRDVLGSDEAMEAARKHWPLVPMNRLGKAEEIAAAYAFLASEDAGYITGQNIIVDGGLRAHSYSIPEELAAK